MKHIENYTIYNESTVYHGSPYDFNEFSSNMIGEGEGASGFGYGFYFSSDKNDAKGYAEKLEREKGAGRLYKVKIPDIKNFLNLDLSISKQNEYIKQCLMKIDINIKEKIIRDYEYIRYKNLFDNFKEDVIKGEYDFEYESDEYTNFLNEMINDMFMSLSRGFFHTMINIFDEVGASEILYNVGIKGNIHTSFGYINYVVFDEKDIQILQKTKPRFK